MHVDDITNSPPSLSSTLPPLSLPERYCVFDSTGGSKIVPIAAGAALGFLVVVILIAYLISQVVARRRKTAYEALN